MNESTVVSMNGGPTGERMVVETAVEAARDLLERAEAGEVVAISYAVSNCDSTATWGNAGLVGGYSLIGAAACAYTALVNREVLE